METNAQTLGPEYGIAPSEFRYSRFDNLDLTRRN